MNRDALTAYVLAKKNGGGGGGQGKDGKDGKDGRDGIDGKSAYELAVEAGTYKGVYLSGVFCPDLLGASTSDIEEMVEYGDGISINYYGCHYVRPTGTEYNVDDVRGVSIGDTSNDPEEGDVVVIRPAFACIDGSAYDYGVCIVGTIGTVTTDRDSRTGTITIDITKPYSVIEDDMYYSDIYVIGEAGIDGKMSEDDWMTGNAIPMTYHMDCGLGLYSGRIFDAELAALEDASTGDIAGDIESGTEWESVMSITGFRGLRAPGHSGVAVIGIIKHRYDAGQHYISVDTSAPYIVVEDSDDSTAKIANDNGIHPQGYPEDWRDRLTDKRVIRSTETDAVAYPTYRNMCYIFGTLDTLQISAGEGDMEVYFQSGATPTVFTTSVDVEMMCGTFTPAANTAYKISIIGGRYGFVSALV